MSEGLSISRLQVVRGGREVIHGVDLVVAPGRITALLGANGAGKSSLVLATAGALPRIPAPSPSTASRSPDCGRKRCGARA